MLKINVSTAEAVITETELITSGRKGLRCAFTFSDDWAGLTKTVIVQGAATRDIALLATNEITVPAECVNKAQFPLKIGVYGARPDGSIAIPTIWASFGKVLPGAKPSLIPPDELTPDVVAQIQEAANNALYLARNVQSMADSGALDGVSPAVTVTSITGGHNVKITDRDHPDGQDFDVPDGQDGADGVSPTISSESITGGHRLTIVDAGGTTTVDVMDGEDGADGVGVPSSGAAGDVLRKASGTDFDTEWHSPEIFWAVYDSTTADEIETARIGGKAIMCAYGGKTYVMNYRQNATKFYFTAADRNSLYHISVSGRSWSSMSTKNVGTYSKPSGGIPASDLVSGISVPTGGTTGQVLKKASGTDYDTEWANESGGGGGTRDYSDLTNKPQIAGVTLSGDKSLADLGIAAASDIPTVPVQSVNNKTGAVVLNASDVGAGTYSKPSGGIPKTDLASAVQTSLGKADTALQTAPVTSVNGQTGAVTLSIPSTASDVGAVAVAQGVANANKVLTVNSSGVVVPEDDRFVVTLTPTAQDLSGVMDKTVAEIDAAYGAGKQVFFRVYVGTDYMETNVTSGGSGSGGYPSFNGFFITNAPYDAAVNLWTGTGASGNTQTYNANIYPLASGQWTGGSY